MCCIYPGLLSSDFSDLSDKHTKPAALAGAQVDSSTASNCAQLYATSHLPLYSKMVLTRAPELAQASVLSGKGEGGPQSAA